MSGVRLKKCLGCNAMTSAGPSISKHIWLQNHLLNQQFSEACLTSSGLIFGSTFNFINKPAEVGNVGAFIVYHLIAILRTQHLSVTRSFCVIWKFVVLLRNKKCIFYLQMKNRNLVFMPFAAAASCCFAHKTRSWKQSSWDTLLPIRMSHTGILNSSSLLF